MFFYSNWALNPVITSHLPIYTHTHIYTHSYISSFYEFKHFLSHTSTSGALWGLVCYPGMQAGGAVNQTTNHVPGRPPTPPHWATQYKWTALQFSHCFFMQFGLHRVPVKLWCYDVYMRRVFHVRNFWPKSITLWITNCKICPILIFIMY